MSSLVCGESRVECATINTLQEVFDQERILSLMDTSDSSTPNLQEEDSEGVPTAPLTPASPPQNRETDFLDEDSEGIPTAPLSPASPPPREETPPQDYSSPCSQRSIKERMRSPGWESQSPIDEGREERGLLKKQLETAIRERRIAERKYEKLLERSGIPPRACKEAGKHGPQYKGRNIEANLSRILKETRRPPQYRPKEMKNQGLK